MPEAYTGFDPISVTLPCWVSTNHAQASAAAASTLLVAHSRRSMISASYALA